MKTISDINGYYPYITTDILEFVERAIVVQAEHERRRKENERIARMLGYPAKKSAEVFMNLFMNDAEEYIQYHSNEMRADDGCSFYGFIEHDIKRNKWAAICLVNDPDNNSHNWSEPDWGMCGTGSTLQEAVNNLKKQDNYRWYPLLEAFG